MKANELRALSSAERTAKRGELKEELFNLRFQPLQLRRCHVSTETYSGRSLVNQINGLIRQKTVIDIAHR